MLLVNGIDRLSLQLLLDRYGLALQLVAPDEVIPGSYWGEREAGLMGSKIFARLDTPLHSVLHESAPPLLDTVPMPLRALEERRGVFENNYLWRLSWARSPAPV